MRRFDLIVPENLPHLLQLWHERFDEAMLIAHGSDLIPRLHRGFVRAKLLLDLSGLRELHYVRAEQGRIRLGALTTIAELVDSSVLRGPYEAFTQVAAKFGGPSIINLATVGGNVAAASSSEDLLPVFLVLDAQVHLRSVNGERVMRVEEFILGKRKVGLMRGEIISEVSFPEVPEHAWCTYVKIGRRNSLIIALVNLALLVEMEPSTQRVREFRLALNRVRGKIPERAKFTEEALMGRVLDDRTISEGANALEQELRLTADYRASGDYRRETATTIFKRALTHSRARILEVAASGPAPPSHDG